ncbi:MAG: TetR/AcrR family transcriptional regulator [Methyloligellaceae bacterium]
MAKRNPKPDSRKQSILDAAERMARDGGYHDVSFRRIADDVGIKSASVFHHFASKEELGAAVARRYTDRFMEVIGDPYDASLSANEKLARYCDAYRHAQKIDSRMCLCGMLGAEISSLPGDVAKEVRRFFDLNIDWLEAALTPARDKPSKRYDARSKAVMVLSALEGAIIVARATGDASLFDQVADYLSIPAAKAI